MTLSHSAPRFWNRIAAKYARTPIADTSAYEHKLSRTRALMTKDMHVLEYGCGTGSTALLHAPFVRSYLALDFSEEMISIAERKPERGAHDNLTFKVGALESFQEDRAFDMVLGLSVLHLVPNWRAALIQTRKMLKPGGYFVSSTACISDMAWYVRVALPLMRVTGFAPFVARFTADQLRAALKDAGFEIVEDWRPKADAALFVIARRPI